MKSLPSAFVLQDKTMEVSYATLLDTNQKFKHKVE